MCIYESELPQSYKKRDGTPHDPKRKETQLSQNDQDLFQEVFWDLFRQNIITLGNRADPSTKSFIKREISSRIFLILDSTSIVLISICVMAMQRDHCGQRKALNSVKKLLHSLNFTSRRTIRKLERIPSAILK